MFMFVSVSLSFSSIFVSLFVGLLVAVYGVCAVLENENNSSSSPSPSPSPPAVLQCVFAYDTSIRMSAREDSNGMSLCSYTKIRSAFLYVGASNSRNAIITNDPTEMKFERLLRPENLPRTIHLIGSACVGTYASNELP